MKLQKIPTMALAMAVQVAVPESLEWQTPDRCVMVVLGDGQRGAWGALNAYDTLDT